MELGVFSLADVNPDSDDTVASRIDDIIDYGRLTERYGLDVFGVGEHHWHLDRDGTPKFDSEITLRCKLLKTQGEISWLGGRDSCRVAASAASRVEA